MEVERKPDFYKYISGVNGRIREWLLNLMNNAGTKASSSKLAMNKFILGVKWFLTEL